MRPEDLIMLLLIFVIMYFLLIRPQQKKVKEHTAMLAALRRGDQIITQGGVVGKIVKVNFGDKKMRIKKSNPKRRKSFRARHNCANPGPRTKARYWSCRKW